MRTEAVDYWAGVSVPTGEAGDHNREIIHNSTDQLLPTRPYPPWEHGGCGLGRSAGDLLVCGEERRGKW